jgi:hypothetical protein
VLIDLRNADREFSLEGLILTHLAKNGLAQVSFDVFILRIPVIVSSDSGRNVSTDSGAS